MTEMILPGTYIEVRDEGLISAGAVTVGNIGIVGTAAKGPIDEPVILGGFNDALRIFGDPGPWIDGNSGELTLVRALRLAFNQGATTVYAVRIASGSAAEASFNLGLSAGSLALAAKSPGTWANGLAVSTLAAEDSAFVEKQTIDTTGAPPFSLPATPVVKNARNQVWLSGTPLQVIYDDDPAAPLPGQVKVTLASGALEFGDVVGTGADIVASYAVAASSAVQVTFKLGEDEEVYRVVDDADLARDLDAGSQWVSATGTPTGATVTAGQNGSFAGGNNGASGADYSEGLKLLLDVAAHIILAAGQDESFGAALAAHCKEASTDARQRERIGVIGTGVNGNAAAENVLNRLLQHQLNSDRLIYVGPGIETAEGTLPGAYTAAAVAGMLAAFSAHISPTNKVLDVGPLERIFTRAELSQIVQARALVLEQRLGTKIVKGITTSTNSAWHQITTRRIVDYAKFGVRSAANPFIGKLNNERVRQSLKGSINGFLADMVDREMLIGYELEVSATREQQIRGEAHVAIILKPTFSIDFIRVVMTLQ